MSFVQKLKEKQKISQSLSRSQYLLSQLINFDQQFDEQLQKKEIRRNSSQNQKKVQSMIIIDKIEEENEFELNQSQEYQLKQGKMSVDQSNKQNKINNKNGYQVQSAEKKKIQQGKINNVKKNLVNQMNQQQAVVNGTKLLSKVHEKNNQQKQIIVLNKVQMNNKNKRDTKSIFYQKYTNQLIQVLKRIFEGTALKLINQIAIRNKNLYIINTIFEEKCIESFKRNKNEFKEKVFFKSNCLKKQQTVSANVSRRSSKIKLKQEEIKYQQMNQSLFQLATQRELAKNVNKSSPDIKKVKKPLTQREKNGQANAMTSRHIQNTMNPDKLISTKLISQLNIGNLNEEKKIGSLSGFESKQKKINLNSNSNSNSSRIQYFDNGNIQHEINLLKAYQQYILKLKQNAFTAFLKNSIINKIQSP